MAFDGLKNVNVIEQKYPYLKSGYKDTSSKCPYQNDFFLISLISQNTSHRKLWGLPFSTYAPRGVGGVKPPLHFHCELHAKRRLVGQDSM